MSEFRGARGSNTGDDYHELWATRHAIRLLDDRDPLKALAVEGLAPVDEASAPDATWDGVDCTLYEGGENAREADRVVLEQLKYSAANPTGTWTVARLTQGKTRSDTVFNRLARAWSGIQALGPKGPVEVVLVTNQQIAPAVVTAVATIAAGGVTIPRSRPVQAAADEAKLAFAAGLTKANLPVFAGSLRFQGNTGSRFAIEEQVLADMSAWTDLELQQAVENLRQFVRKRMRPEFAGELITKEKVLLGLGLSDIGALFPCQPDLSSITQPVPRESVAEAARLIVGGEQRLCLHGPGGIGKTTALQEIKTALPANSVMIVFDCYGGGRYLDPSALRHRPIDAFLQLSNELATHLRLPILLSRHHTSDPVRLFANRLRHAAHAHAAQYPEALIVIAVDAADNAVTAAGARNPTEPCFVHDFVGLGDLPPNVRLVITARTGRLPEIALPFNFRTAKILPFTRAETAEHVRRTWSAPDEWLNIFHELSAGVPRVQTYAMDLGGESPEEAINRLLPGGRSLDQVFREQFERALGKSGSPSDVAKFCAGLVILARPIPLADLSGVLSVSVPMLVDICSDMVPAIRLEEGKVRFADEDFEHFVRKEGASAQVAVTQSAAAWLLSRCNSDAYAAQNVAGALTAAERGADLLELVEREPVPEIVTDPVQRREASLTRLRLAISVCRNASDPARALRFVLIGGEGLKTERALCTLLCDNPDLAVRFAPETAGRLILTDPGQVGAHGAFLLHKLAIDAAAGDRISLREGGRMINAWMAARNDAIQEHRAHDWRLTDADIAAEVEALLRTRGPKEALVSLWSWRPTRVRIDVAKVLVHRLLAEGQTDLLQSVIDTGELHPWEEIFLLVPMTIAGLPIAPERLACGLEALMRRRLNIRRFFASSAYDVAHLSWVFDVAMCACELLTRSGHANVLVDSFLTEVLQPANRSITIHSPSDTAQLDLLFRAYALSVARVGKTADPSDLYEPRPKLPEKQAWHEITQREEEADRRLKEVTAAVFGVYVGRAMVLVGAKVEESPEEMLRRYAELPKDEHRRYVNRPAATALAKVTARSMLVLLATNLEPQLLADLAIQIHHRGEASDLTPDEEFVSRLALRSDLHTILVKDVDKSVREVRGRRIGAGDKSKTLVAYARQLLPVSPADANAVFNDAVEAASQLDREIISQFHFLGAVFARGIDDVGDRRSVARELSDIVADAAIRLDDGLPWEEVMKTLAALDLPVALANAAKWDDSDLVRFCQTLAPVLKAGLMTGDLTPAAAMALDLLLDGDHHVVDAALTMTAAFNTSSGSFFEEAAWDSLIRHNHRSAEKLLERVATVKDAGRWTTALTERQAFLIRLPPEKHAEPSHSEPNWHNYDRQSDLVKPSWTREILLNPEELDRVVIETLKNARATKHYISASEVMERAATCVEIRDRVAFLDTLCATKVGIGGEVVERLLKLLEQWNSPAIRSWALTRLPEVIVARFPEFVRRITYDDAALLRAITLAGLLPEKIVNLLLSGVELHSQALDADQVFRLASLVSAYLDSPSAAKLAVWYTGRLAGRIAPDDRDQAADSSELPTVVPVAVARLIYGCLGDYDVRVRWRAAHAIRRLARLTATAELKALISEYGRQKETVFRSPKLEFYWIAARLWFVIAWDRIASEVPDIGLLAGPVLLTVAHDEDFPHVLVRSFARDACLKLVGAGQLSLGPVELGLLEAVARSQLAPQPAPKHCSRESRSRRNGKERRFYFDSIDTIPYWYEPVLSSFANVSLDQLLDIAESWIIDRWGNRGDIYAYDAEPRRHRFSDQDWSLSSNSHGSHPTLERLNTHLKWHALWCAIGELMRTEPLIAHDEPEWDALPQRIAREMLIEPPLWSADLRAPIPLRQDFWRGSYTPLPEWVKDVCEGRLRSELEAVDRPGYIVVDGWWEIRSSDRVEVVAFSSALVEPTAANALLRALQTMESAWDYKLPDESEERFELNIPPYQMVGWILNVSSDGRIDEQDPLRGRAKNVDLRPGKRVRDACGLQQVEIGAPVWSAPDRLPMFIYEVWGEGDSGDEGYSTVPAVSGRRLLVERGQLIEFLQGEGLDLLIEVEVRREGRGNRRSYDSEDDTPEARYDRLYRLDRAGGLHVAEGRIGTWTDDRPPA